MANGQIPSFWDRLKSVLGFGGASSGHDIPSARPFASSTSSPDKSYSGDVASTSPAMPTHHLERYVLNGRQENPQQPVAVIGGGLAGLLTLKKLIEAGVPAVLYEANSKVGGRIQSQHGNSKGLLDEGAEFIDSKHRELLDVRAELEAKGYPRLTLIDSQPTTGPEGSTHTHFHVQGKILRATDFLNHETGEGLYVPLANRIRTDQKLLRTENGGWTQHAVRLDQLTAQEYLDQLKATGTSIPPEVEEMISIAYRGETGRELHQISALALIDQIGARTDRPFSIYGESDEAYKIEGGTHALIEALEKDIRNMARAKKMPDPIRAGHQLMRIDSTNDSKVLTFQQKESGQPVQVQTPYVISAMPLPVLAHIPGVENLGLTDQQIHIAKNMQYTKSSKIFLEVHGEPWKDSAVKDSDGVFYGRTFQLAWPSGDGKPTQNGKGWVTMLVGGDMNNLTPAELLKQCKEEYASMLGKPVDQVFTGEQRIVSAYKQDEKAAKGSTTGCYISPGRGQYLQAVGLSRELQSMSGNVGFAGSYMIHEDLRHGEPITWVGFANVAAHSGIHSAEKCIQAFRQKAHVETRQHNVPMQPVASYIQMVSDQKLASSQGVALPR